MKDASSMMKQAQKIQSKIASLQNELANKTIETTVGGGMVKVVSSGAQKIISVKIEREVVDPNDIEMLQDLVVVGVNDALAKSQEMASNEMSKITGGLKIPGIM